jgi:hypothetical protein
LNILGPSYGGEDFDSKKSLKKARINVIFEEKDRRSFMSKERNKISSLLSTRSWVDLEMSDFVTDAYLEFDFQSKYFNISIKGIDMDKLDFSGLDLGSLPVALKTFVKQNSNNQGKKSTNSIRSDHTKSNTLFDNSQ